MTEPIPNPRRPDAPVDPEFLDRWSPRSFTDEPVTGAELASLLEAARWAPSCFNEQPWRFVWARSDEDRRRFADLLTEKNRAWASRAPLLLFVVWSHTFEKNGKPNRAAPFDAGAAWMSLALEARKLGLYTHAMIGFDLERSYEVLGVDPARFEVACAVAVGRRGDPAALDEEQRSKEKPNDRRPVSSFAFEGRLPAET